MTETELRAQLHAALDSATPPADLFARALRGQVTNRRSTRRRVLVGVGALVAVALVLALVVNMGSSHRRVRVIDTPPSTIAIFAATNSIDPITDFIEKHSMGRDYLSAVDKSVAACMQSKRWDLEPRIVDSRRDYGAGTGPTDPTELLRFRKLYGYGYLNAQPISPAELEAHNAAKNNDYFSSLSPEAKLRYTRDLGSGPDERDMGATAAATPVSGCRGAAEVAERRIIPALPHSVEHELATRLNAVYSDPAYLAAQHEWSACMARGGFRFRRATDAQASISNLFAPPPSDPNAPTLPPDAASQERGAALERRTGTADADCAVTTVWPVQRRLELPILQDVITRYGRNALCAKSCP